MLILAASAAFVGFVHSLAPGHWLPIVLMAKSRRWTLQHLLLGAAVAATGHIVISGLLGFVSIFLGAEIVQRLHSSEDQIEHWAALLLVAFGITYAIWTYFRHSHCHDHEHHGPSPERRKKPYLFLFSLGFSPCVAALPIFLASSAYGWAYTVISMLAFSLGVLFSLSTATAVMFRGIARLDHPILEHYGDVITGLSLSLMGGILFFWNPF